jgi:hypothetical protein
MTTTDDLYGLLPAVHRLRDADGPLRALVEVLATQADVVDADLDHLADAWFVETCADWLVPYLGDLLSATPLHPIADAEPRAYVARTLQYRQRKGTVAVLEQLARDVTGWPTRAVELLELLAWTQHINHPRLHRPATPDLRDPEAGALVGGPFDTAPRTVEVRRLATRGGRYHPANVGLFAYRLQPQSIARAWAAPGGPAGRWHVDPLGRDVPLYNPGRPAAAMTDLAREPDLPGPLRRRPLADELEKLRDPAARARREWFTDQRPVAAIEVRLAADADWEPVPAGEIVICDLAGWRPPPASRSYPDPHGAGDVERPVRAAFDPVLGRVAFRPEHDPADVRTAHTTAAPMPVGGGPYDRRAHRPAGRPPPDRRFLVGQDLPLRDGMFATLADAVAAWRADTAGTSEIVITDNGIYPDDLVGANRLDLPAGAALRMIAAAAPVPAAGQLPDPAVPLHPAGLRPVLTGRVNVRGAGGGTLVLDGLWVAGDLTVLVGTLSRLGLVDTTLVPGRAELEVRAGAAGGNDALVLELTRSVTAPLLLGDTTAALRLHACVVDGDGQAVDATRTDVEITDSTVLGAVAARSLAADSTIFTGAVEVERRQVGCLSYCVLPTRDPTVTPRRYRCQPDLALAAAADRDTNEVDPQTEAVIRARLRPVFTARDHGHPAYCQLGPRCAPEITAGAADGAEMGVHRALGQPARRSNLATATDEYLRTGLEAGPLFIT